MLKRIAEFWKNGGASKVCIGGVAVIVLSIFCLAIVDSLSLATWGSVWGGIAVCAVFALIIVALGFLLYLPGMIAQSRKHSKAESIKVCGIVGIIFWPAWFVALIWAYSENNDKPVYSSMPDRTLPVDELGDRLRMP